MMQTMRYLILAIQEIRWIYKFFMFNWIDFIFFKYRKISLKLYLFYFWIWKRIRNVTRHVNLWYWNYCRRSDAALPLGCNRVKCITVHSFEGHIELSIYKHYMWLEDHSWSKLNQYIILANTRWMTNYIYDIIEIFRGKSVGFSFGI